MWVFSGPSNAELDLIATYLVARLYLLRVANSIPADQDKKVRMELSGRAALLSLDNVLREARDLKVKHRLGLVTCKRLASKVFKGLVAEGVAENEARYAADKLWVTLI